MYRTASTGSALAACVTLGGCGLLPTTSDVPCLRPTAWADDSDPILMRLEPGGDGALLLTSLTRVQFLADIEDRILGNENHEGVYRLDRATGDFERVADEQWDELDTPAGTPASGFNAGTPFVVDGGRLQFEGRTVALAGGTLLTLDPAPSHDVIAVLSTSGSPFDSLLSGGAADGQHYHRLYSEVDGSPLGRAVRLGVGGKDKNLVNMGWGPDDRYVVYFQTDREGAFDVLCVVFVGDEIDRIDSEEP